MCVCASLYALIQFVSKYHQASLHHIDASRAFTLCAKHVTFKVHGNTLNTQLCNIFTEWHSTRICDCTVSYTQEQVCYFTVGDCCRVFLLHTMYEGVETAVIIWCWTSGQMAFAWQYMSVYNPPYFHSYCCICMYISIPINVGTVIVSFINNKKFQEQKAS